MKLINNKLLYYLFLLASSSTLMACTGKANETSTDIATADVTVLQLYEEDTQQFFEYPATIRGQQNVEIRPKVDGYIAEILVDEGAQVSKGQVLFRINNPLYEQEVITAKAAIKRAESAVNTANINVKKTSPLVEKGIISEFELEAKNLELQARLAELEESKAKLHNAQVNLGYTVISSPVSGVIGTIPYKIGSLVSSMNELPLTILSDISKVHVYFSFSESQFLSLISDSDKKNINDAINNIPPVELRLASGDFYPQKGTIETTGGLINTGTGAISMRAVFPNAEGLIRSGSSAIIRIARAVDHAILIPETATYEIQGNKFAVLVDSAGLSKSVAIEVADLPINDSFLVTKGLRSGDRIVTENVTAIKDGTKINPKGTQALSQK
ncbi:efflux RND transporter periplasmic adaptor subunit [Sphingobacterium sp. HJSM2_6]|uniref:efflux RND transporter periplasmic adaptor subunit n=1 Tax=Sphingobacterium sp. HJSM2_6 TaxID=3366264 RepID=UPI003BED9608